MPQSENWPFKRLFVDHLFHGTSRIWWEIDPTFTEEGPYTFQLQAGYTGNNDALDWIDIGAAAVNAFFLTDDTVREHTGKKQLTHYRVLLTTPLRRYISYPQGITGYLDTKDWLFARELVRKERIRQQNVSANGFLLRRFHYGVRNEKNTDFLTGGIIDSAHPASWGTEFKVGYHPPVPVSVDFGLETINFQRGGSDVSKHNSRNDTVYGTIVAFPDIFTEDIWVDASTDQRYSIGAIKTTAAWKRVPLIYSVELNLLPFSDVAYKIPIDPAFSYQPGEVSGTPGIGGILGEAGAPLLGTGCVRIDHNYRCEGAYIYQRKVDCCPIEGATVTIFTSADWYGGARTPANACVVTQTTVGGAWTWAVQLDPGEYVILFEKPGEYGPDVACLSVETPDPGPPPAPYCNRSSESFSSLFGSV